MMSERPGGGEVPAALLAGAGGALCSAAALLPWKIARYATFSLTPAHVDYFSGMASPWGYVVLLAAVVAVTTSLAHVGISLIKPTERATFRLLPLLCGGVLTVAIALAFADFPIYTRRVSIGIGFWMAVVGAVACLIGGVLLARPPSS